MQRRHSVQLCPATPLPKVGVGVDLSSMTDVLLHNTRSGLWRRNGSGMKLTRGVCTLRHGKGLYNVACAQLEVGRRCRGLDDFLHGISQHYATLVLHDCMSTTSCTAIRYIAHCTRNTANSPAICGSKHCRCVSNLAAKMRRDALCRWRVACCMSTAEHSPGEVACNVHFAQLQRVATHHTS